MPGPKPSKPKPEVLEQKIAALKERLAEAEKEIATLKVKLHARRITSAAVVLGFFPDRSWVTRLTAGANSGDAVLEERLLAEAWAAAVKVIRRRGARIGRAPR
jgi:hypothetical protein